MILPVRQLAQVSAGKCRLSVRSDIITTAPGTLVMPTDRFVEIKE